MRPAFTQLRLPTAFTLFLFLSASLAPSAQAEDDNKEDDNKEDDNKEDDNKEGRLDIEAAQALLDVGALDGWLLTQSAKSAKLHNPIAQELVGPGPTKRAWFFWIPANGNAVALFHRTDENAFTNITGDKKQYSNNRQLKTTLQKIIGDAKTIAMEYAPKSGITSLTRVDARTAKMVQSIGVTITSSAQLVQVTKAAWGIEGRISHYVAAHHLRKLIDEALVMIGERLSKGTLLTEYEVQQFIIRGYKIRGLSGEPPLVATGINTANPSYRPSARSSSVIKKGDLIQLELSGHVINAKRPIVADLSWVAYVGDDVPDPLEKTFAVVASARKKVLDLIRIRLAEGRPVAGYEADQAAQDVIANAGMTKQLAHGTGHSLDTSLAGDGANLDGLLVRDTRNLVVGSGFTIGPGLYIDGEYGVRSEVDVFLGASGLELTTKPQTRISTIKLVPPQALE